MRYFTLAQALTITVVAATGCQSDYNRHTSPFTIIQGNQPADIPLETRLENLSAGESLQSDDGSLYVICNPGPPDMEIIKIAEPRSGHYDYFLRQEHGYAKISETDFLYWWNKLK